MAIAKEKTWSETTKEAVIRTAPIYGLYYTFFVKPSQAVFVPDIAPIMLEFRNTIVNFREKAEDWWLPSYFYETNQRFKINNDVLVQKISDAKAVTGYAQCSSKNVLRVAHYFETNHPLPIANTPVKLEPVKAVQRELRGGLAYNYYDGKTYWETIDGGSVLTGTTNSDGIAEFQNCEENQNYKVTFYPDINPQDINTLYDSYQPILKYLSTWLITQWGANEAEAKKAAAELFATSNPNPQQIATLFENISKKNKGGFEQRWRTFESLSENERQLVLAECALAGIGKALENAWKMIVEVWKFFADFDKNYEKIKKFFGDLTREQVEACAEKIFLVLNDKGLLFVLYATFVTWLTLLPPQDTMTISTSIITDVIIGIVVGVALTAGAGLAVKSASVAKDLITKSVSTGAKNAAQVLKTKAINPLDDLINVFMTVCKDGQLKKLIDSYLIAKSKPIAYSGTVIASYTRNTFEFAGKKYDDVILVGRRLQHELATFIERSRKTIKKEHNKTGKTPNNQPHLAACNTKTGGCPVSMVTGEELLTLTDGELEGSLPFIWKRLYRTSAVEENKGLGFGWGHSLSHTLTFDGDYVLWNNDENIITTLPLPTKEIPQGVNHLAEAAIFLGNDESELVLAQANGQGFYHFRLTVQGAQLEAISDKYDNRIFINRDLTGEVHRIHNGAGRGLLFRYDAGHIVGIDYQQKIIGDTEENSWQTLQTLVSYDYNQRGQLIKATNAAGQSEHYRYDEHNVIQERIMPGGAAFYWQWQGQGKQVRAIKHWSNFGQSQTYEWDDNGTVKVMNEDGSQEVYTHDSNAKLIKHVAPDGGTQLKVYDDKGNLVIERTALGAEMRYQYDEDDQLRMVIPAEGEVIQYGYDKGSINRVFQGAAQWRYQRNDKGDIVEQTDPNGFITCYDYTSTGKISAIRYPDGSKHQLTWNRLGQLIEETLPQGGIRRYRYDSLGNQIFRQDENQQITRFDYDEMGQLLKVTYSNATSKQFKYNAYGKITEIIDEQGWVTRYEYLPHLHKISRKINPDGSEVVYSYNSQLNLTQITNEQGENYYLNYYPNGLISEEIGFDGRKTRYQYDLAGNLIEKTEYDEQGKDYTTAYLRSPTGKLLQKTLPDGKTIDYSYTEQGLLKAVDDGQWPLHYEYDLTGKLTAEHQGWATLRYQYSPLGILSQCQLPDGNIIDYQHSQGGVLKQVNLNSQMLTGHAYSQGREIARQQGSLTSHYEYDEQGRLKTHFINQTDKTFYQRQYRYNVKSHLTAINDSRKGVRQYRYDPLDRLIQVRGDISEDLVYDPANNLLAQSHQMQQVNIKGNRLLMQSDKHYIYDDFGNLIQERRGKGQQLVTRYAYDSQHQLTQLVSFDGTTSAYEYDAFGRRISKTVTDRFGNKTKTAFIWLGDKLLAESSKHHYQSYIYEPDSFKPLVLLKGKGREAEVYYYQLDHLGTPQELTSSKGHIVWSARYKAYGNLALIDVYELEQPLRFQGQYHDLETGLYYNRHRYYSPDTGRYITPDPIKLAGGLNSYQYVTNPVGIIDPLGLSACPPDGGNTSTVPEKNAAVNAGEPPPPKPDFYVGPNGPEDTLPATAYRYERYLNDDGTPYRRGIDMLEKGEGKVTYFGFEKYETGKQARDAFQIKGRDKIDPLDPLDGSWSDARIRGEFDTLQLYINGKPQVRHPKEMGDKGTNLEPFTTSYPEYGKGGKQQMHGDLRDIKYDKVDILPEG